MAPIDSTTDDELKVNGFTVINNVYTPEEVAELAAMVSDATRSTANDVHAIRRVLQEVPALQNLVFNTALNQLISQLFGSNYAPVRSVYFDKPAGSNWFVSYHQDLTISVQARVEEPGYEKWTVKNGHYAVQAPRKLLENIFTIRIHLDDTDATNGALKVIPGSHRNGMQRAPDAGQIENLEAICAVPAGGIMIMRPLLMHASSRSTGNRSRRVIHIEFCNQEVPGRLAWSERVSGTCSA